MFEKIIYWILAIATLIGGIAAVDYFCKECVKKFYNMFKIKKKAKKNQTILEEPEGQVPLDSHFYVERPPIESEGYETIVKLDALIRIKAPRQMGKSSLMTRILHHAKQQNYRTVSLSFQEADSTVFANLDSFLHWLCGSVTEQLELPNNQLAAHWQGILGSKNKCTNYFQKYLLTEMTSPLVLGLDEVDLIFQHETIAKDFLGLLRAWHEKGKNDDTWKKLRLVIVHSQEVYIPLSMDQSPFNVGTAIELPEFNQAQVQDLVQRHKLVWTVAQVEQLMAMVGGHPYLVRVALYKIARGRISLEQLLKLAPNEEGPYSTHLHRHLLNLQADAELATTIKKVVAANEPVPIQEIGDVFKLRSMGLVKIENDAVMPLCDLYRSYFNNRL